MQSPDRIPLSRFPADLTSILVLPATVIFFVVASCLPLFWRTTLFAFLGVGLIVVAIRLVRSGRRVVFWVWAAIYLLMGIGVLYVAYIEATLFA
jgi:hypothetical protein